MRVAAPHTRDSAPANGSPNLTRAKVRVAAPDTHRSARSNGIPVFRPRQSAGRRARHPPFGADERAHIAAARRAVSPRAPAGNFQGPGCDSPHPRIFTRAKVRVPTPRTSDSAPANSVPELHPRQSAGPHAPHPRFGAGEQHPRTSPAAKCGSPRPTPTIWRGRTASSNFTGAIVRVPMLRTRHSARANGIPVFHLRHIAAARRAVPPRAPAGNFQGPGCDSPLPPSDLHPRQSAGPHAPHPRFGAGEQHPRVSPAPKCGSRPRTPPIRRGRTKRSPSPGAAAEPAPVPPGNDEAPRAEARGAAS